MSWSIKELKRNGKIVMKRNYLQIVIACLIVAVFAGAYSASSTDSRIVDGNSSQGTISIANSLTDIINNYRVNSKDKVEIIEIEDTFKLKNATEGVIATVINNSGASKSLSIGVLNTINQFVFKSKMVEGTVILLATFVGLLFSIFVRNILLIGESRFQLENKYYSETNVDRLLFVYKKRKTLHVAYIMFCKALFTFLWCFTIIGGFVKYYSYIMIPYIIAENPNVSRKEAFLLSKKMMKGNKWKTFLLGISFWGWHILSALTFGLLRHMYVNPFMGATYAELYYTLRSSLIEKREPIAVLFTDKHLSVPVSEIVKHYPVEISLEKEVIFVPTFKLNYERNYSGTSIIFIFFVMSFIGWGWEVFYGILETGALANRGILFGPWLPIYGSGSVLMLIVLKRLRNKPLVLFSSMVILCGFLEYFTSVVLEKKFGQLWWDYKNAFFNINGRVCLEGLLFFAIGGFLIVYFIAPIIDELVSLINKRIKRIVCIVLISLFVVDVVHSTYKPNQGDGITHSTEKKEQRTVIKKYCGEA